MIDIKDNAGNVIFTGNVDEAEEFLKRKMKLETEAKEKNMQGWAEDALLAMVFAFALSVVYNLIVS